jgi:hypothetical protein
MFDYLEKFNNLDSELKKIVSSPEAVLKIEKLEDEFKVDLASLAMRVMIKDIKVDQLPLILFTELGLNQDNSEKLAKRLKKDIFFEAKDYLGFKEEEIKEVVPTEERPKKNLKKNIKTGDQKKKVSPKIDLEKKELDKKEPEVKDKDIPEEDSWESDFSKEPKKQDILSRYHKEDYREKIAVKVKKIIDILKIDFKDEEKNNKFFSLLNKYIRGVKDRFIVRQIFTQNIESGGFGLSDKMVDHIFMIDEKMKEKDDDDIKKDIKVEEGVLKNIAKLSYGQVAEEKGAKSIDIQDFSHTLAPPHPAVIEKPLDEEVKKDDPVDFSHTLAPLHPAVIEKEDEVFEGEDDQEEELDLKTEAFKEDVLEDDSKGEVFSSKTVKDLDSPGQDSREDEGRTPPSIKKNFPPMSVGSNGKVRMTDVKKVKITGPIDEIRYMDLVNFRRLSDSPAESFNKINKKLKVLEEVDYSKMIEGIKAWRQSPINKLYLKIFSKSSNEGHSVDSVIEELKDSGKDYLSKEEIKALMDFNKTLNF